MDFCRHASSYIQAADVSIYQNSIEDSTGGYFVCMLVACESLDFGQTQKIRKIRLKIAAGFCFDRSKLISPCESEFTNSFYDVLKTF